MKMILKRSGFLGLILAVASATLAAATPQARAQRATPDNDPDMKEMRDYRLSLDNIQKYIAAYKALASDPTAVCFKNNPPGNAKTLAEGDKIIAGCGKAAADISGAGLKPHDFLVMTGALIGDVMAVGMKKQGTIKQYPPTISPENAAFLEQNYDKIQVMLAPLMGGGGPIP
jgi:hypothetical protein